PSVAQAPASQVCSISSQAPWQGLGPEMQPLSVLHVSSPSQNRPLSHTAWSGVWLQPCIPSSHASIVQAIPSSHCTGAPATQPLTGSHSSAPSQKVPLSHTASFGAWTQASLTSSQLSTVQATPSSHATGVPETHTPAWHASAPLQYRPSSHSASVVQLVGGSCVPQISTSSMFQPQYCTTLSVAPMVQRT